VTYDTRGQLGPDECLRILQLIPTTSGTDFVMSVSSRNGGNVVEGESSRLWNGRAQLDIEGYYNSVSFITNTGGPMAGLTSSSLIVVRYCDKATASLGSILVSRNDQLTVRISTYRATGDRFAATESALQLEFANAMLTQQALFTGGSDGRPMEILAIAYRNYEIRSAPQSATGAIGPVITCQILET